MMQDAKPLARFALAGCLLAALACQPAPPSVLVVTLDTLRQDHVGAYGARPSPTPHLDALAREGLVHEQAFTTMPTTGPAHLSLFTGRYPSQTGTTRNTVPLRLDDAETSLEVRLRREGYSTGAFVSTLLAAPGATGLSGFDVYDAPETVLRPGSDAVDAALAWLDSQSQRPVFIWLHLYDAHAPYGDLQQKGAGIPLDESRYGWIDAERFRDGETARQMTADYRKGVTIADAELARFVEGARERLGDPLIVIVSDHGESLTEHLAGRGYAFDHGEFLDEEALRIPLVVVGPEVAAGRSSAAVSIRDLYTTVLAAAGLEDPEALTEERRDLRGPEDTRRIVGIERRSFGTTPPRGGPDHAGAASDGEQVVIVDTAGHSASAADAELLAAARLRAEEARRAADRTLPELSPATREALRQLGYAE